MAFSAPTTMLRSVAVTRFISKSVHLATPCLSSHTVIWWVLPTQRKKPRQWLLRSRLLMDQVMKVRCSPDLMLFHLNLYASKRIFALLTGYRDPPAGISIREGLHYNPYFPGGAIAMPKMLNDEAVEYEDGTSATEAQMGKDVVSFLSWAAEPEMEVRKLMGFKWIILLSLFLLQAAYYRETEMWVRHWKWSVLKSRKLVLDVVN
ncbi:BnaC04g32920D [Brassica napus]|uniref:BnaC04g32920D protein n=1 Tax=Brassica napus TaxID=3708 RepID=A0A078HG41_BRANA|nr:BnaC04g32920D [Brassica napus]